MSDQRNLNAVTPLKGSSNTEDSRSLSVKDLKGIVAQKQIAIRQLAKDIVELKGLIAAKQKLEAIHSYNYSWNNFLAIASVWWKDKIKTPSLSLSTAVIAGMTYFTRQFYLQHYKNSRIYAKALWNYVKDNNQFRHHLKIWCDSYETLKSTLPVDKSKDSHDKLVEFYRSFYERHAYVFRVLETRLLAPEAHWQHLAVNHWQHSIIHPTESNMTQTHAFPIHVNSTAMTQAHTSPTQLHESHADDVMVEKPLSASVSDHESDRETFLNDLMAFDDFFDGTFTFTSESLFDNEDSNILNVYDDSNFYVSKMLYILLLTSYYDLISKLTIMLSLLTA